MSTPDMAPVGALVGIELPDGTMLPSQVQEADGGDLALTAPSLIGDVLLPRPGDQIAVQWASGRGLWVVPAQLVAIEQGPAVWRVRIAGDADVQQRRRFARAPVDGTVSLITESRPSKVRLGWLLDVSEGGLRCRFESDGDIAGDRVTVRFVVDDETVEIPGVLLRVDPAPQSMDVLVVEFQEEHKLAEKLRRFVMQEQLRRRREGLR